jgi:hypothetical protein
VSPERPLEEILPEPNFAGMLQAQGAVFGQLANVLTALPADAWSKKFFYRLSSEANALESFLDDYGAKYNRAFTLTRELVASVRWLAQAGISLRHFEGRFQSYGLDVSLPAEVAEELLGSLSKASVFLAESCRALLTRLRAEFDRKGVAWPAARLPDHQFAETGARQLLPRNVDHDDLSDENQRIAEIASKYIAACSMLGELGKKAVTDPEERRRKLSALCREEQARVYEATVHNLQSAYDTYIKNTVIESRDVRLARLRGHLSGALHLLEAVTFLTHFVERHDHGVRDESADQVIGGLVERALVQDLILNHLLRGANRLMHLGRPMAEELLPTYITLQELQVQLPRNVRLHARPAALIVNIVAHHGTPVEMRVEGHRCNAGSILELLVAVGSHPEAQAYVFRGDIHPLRDIALLFESGLGEDGIENLPAQLAYLRNN